MMRRIWDWLIGVKRKDRPYAYHRHRAWEAREKVEQDYLHPRDIQIGLMPEKVAGYEPIIRTGYGYGIGARQVEMWVYQKQLQAEMWLEQFEIRQWQKQRLAELRHRAARRRELRETWGWMDLPIREVLDLWPRSGLASL